MSRAEEKTNKADSNMLPLVEEFYSIQGEGYHTGKPAYFIRLGGCDTGCHWCDSPYTWNPDIHPLTSVDNIVKNVLYSGTNSVVVTGGEPLMWNLDNLCRSLKDNNIMTFLETSGVYGISGIWDWICLSPKKNRPPLKIICNIANELKVIIENEDDFKWAEICRSKVNSDCILYLQPEWSKFKTITPIIVDYVKKNTSWRISLQTHKFMNIP
ncbi:MAG TPA: 7-carboxy-7-deazaguanine synthase QueE [Bacteroidales bacterium]|nr:7-carboxy-7-deazaguanine synthase QueE [Bacteroidales bacterium]HCI55899.1 7-carboxy-7-deazaguanine synthase QueE [Bacteroidales bacterium]HOU95091.1 7-carboxy-7-deazaguanine synthase QueE [Bacteroidales bacterium]HQG36419.1 7-carboxy-7-deazaguanine synthase QueE [Bacteroidales bacterium]HQJ20511.1 7-carboxy-7-deazaguanine synthase QueE [Bacteroidales bacterium]